VRRGLGEVQLADDIGKSQPRISGPGQELDDVENPGGRRRGRSANGLTPLRRGSYSYTQAFEILYRLFEKATRHCALLC
jgi:hypothetical protein